MISDFMTTRGFLLHVYWLVRFGAGCTLLCHVVTTLPSMNSALLLIGYLMPFTCISYTGHKRTDSQSDIDYYDEIITDLVQCGCNEIILNMYTILQMFVCVLIQC